jgi:choline dehydrogenase
VFDYVVVGAGSAGCVVASRLTEDPSTRVLLLEAGGSDRRPLVRIPAGFYKLFRSGADWQYTTEPQAALNGRRLYWPRGKLLGGSSSINAMIYTRGHPADYDGWRAAGNEGWGFADVLPCFKKAENQERGPSDWHGTGGPLEVADLRSPNPLSHVYLEACAELGLPRSADFNGPCQDGVGFYQVTQKAGRRCSVASAYLAPARKRPNLTVLTGAHTTRILFERGRAVGVEYLRRGRVEQARAGREVVLCGGAVNSPQLLLLSGVGPRAHLEKLGIPVVMDLPGVGQNLQDHPIIGACHVCTRPVSLDRADTLGNILRYLLTRRGPLTSNIAESGGFVRTDPGLAAPDLQLYFAPAFYIEHGFVRPAGHGFSLGACLLRPHSRGEITLRSRDPLQAPLIQPAYLREQGDLDVLLAGLRLIRRIARASAFDAYRGPELLPGEDVIEEALAEYVRQRVETLYHPAGTCKMGEDPLAVVDARLRVHGAAGLRVVDASVMPALPGGNTNAPVVMIAEMAVELMRGRPPSGREAVARVAVDHLPG